MVKYRLSNNVAIIPKDNIYMDTSQEDRQAHYVLSDKMSNRGFLINETVKYFIDKFSYPKTLFGVLEEIALDIQRDIKKIEKERFAFFRFVCNSTLSYSNIDILFSLSLCHLGFG
jgi:hypothetical protein